MKPVKTPFDLFGELFVDLHCSGIWKDGKLISDAIPNFPAAEILNKYNSEKSQDGFDLKTFFEANFSMLRAADSKFESDLSKSPEQHIESLWSVLKRPADSEESDSSRIGLPFPYIVPGGRFNEIYYWDSYFTMLGLKIHHKVDIIEQMIENFAWLINTYGFIPNGSRSYFLGRSQPPFFCLMIELLGEIKGGEMFVKYKNALAKEYDFWMDYEGETHKRRCTLGEQILNRYHDNHSRPREEMYGDDMDLLSKTDRSSESLFGDIRAACESGWDFSSRWFDDPMRLETIRTSSLIPVDLNCLLYKLESILAGISEIEENEGKFAHYSARANARKSAIQSEFWNDRIGFFTDYDLPNQKPNDHINLGGVYPLFFKIATEDQASKVAFLIEKKFLAEGGLLTTTIESGQQWDAPNGWPPLQWMTVKGLDNYGFVELAKTCAQRWVTLNEKVYHATGKFVEKYNVVDLTLEAGGGEYPVQDGFGWSNGVYLALKNYLST